MTKKSIPDVGIKYIRLIQQQQIELAVLKAERDAALRDRDQAQARSKAMDTLFDALLGSLRPFGFRRRRFQSAVRQAAKAIPNKGPDSFQHAALLEGSNRVIKNTNSRSYSALNA